MFGAISRAGQLRCPKDMATHGQGRVPQPESVVVGSPAAPCRDPQGASCRLVKGEE